MNQNPEVIEYQIMPSGQTVGYMSALQLEGYFSQPPLPLLDLCFYCGNLLAAETVQCPGCGARDWARRHHVRR